MQIMRNGAALLPWDTRAFRIIFPSTLYVRPSSFSSTALSAFKNFTYTSRKWLPHSPAPKNSLLASRPTAFNNCRDGY